MRMGIILGGAAALWPYGLALGAVVVGRRLWRCRHDNRVTVQPDPSNAADAPLTLVHLPRDRRRRRA